jgi:hypothetical protein
MLPYQTIGRVNYAEYHYRRDPSTAIWPPPKFQYLRRGIRGHHLGDAPDLQTAIRLVRQAVDGGVTFFDNCWEYHRGKTEDWMGAGLKRVRDRMSADEWLLQTIRVIDIVPTELNFDAGRDLIRIAM